MGPSTLGRLKVVSFIEGRGQVGFLSCGCDPRSSGGGEVIENGLPRKLDFPKDGGPGFWFQGGKLGGCGSRLIACGCAVWLIGIRRHFGGFPVRRDDWGYIFTFLCLGGERIGDLREDEPIERDTAIMATAKCRASFGGGDSFGDKEGFGAEEGICHSSDIFGFFPLLLVTPDNAIVGYLGTYVVRIFLI